MFYLRSFSALLLCIAISACTKKDPKIEEEPVRTGSVAFNFQAKVNEELLVPITKMYTTTSKDSFTVSKLNYYISNVKLIREDGFVYSEPQSYHLIQHVEGKTSFKLSEITEGSYTKIEFLIGVDSIGNVSGVHTGALDLANDMYWQWEGYLFLKMEGVFNSQERPETSDYAFHVGGYKAPNPCLQKCSFNLAAPLVSKNGQHVSVFYNVQIDELFVRPLVIGFDYYYDNITKDAKIFQKISDNYKDMFVISKIEN